MLPFPLGAAISHTNLPPLFTRSTMPLPSEPQCDSCARIVMPTTLFQSSICQGFPPCQPINRACGASDGESQLGWPVVVMLGFNCGRASSPRRQLTFLALRLQNLAGHARSYNSHHMRPSTYKAPLSRSFIIPSITRHPAPSSMSPALLSL